VTVFDNGTAWKLTGPITMLGQPDPPIIIHQRGPAATTTTTTTTTSRTTTKTTRGVAGYLLTSRRPLTGVVATFNLPSLSQSSGVKELDIGVALLSSQHNLIIGFEESLTMVPRCAPAALCPFITVNGRTGPTPSVTPAYGGNDPITVSARNRGGTTYFITMLDGSHNNHCATSKCLLWTGSVNVGGPLYGALFFVGPASQQMPILNPPNPTFRDIYVYPRSNAMSVVRIILREHGVTDTPSIYDANQGGKFSIYQS
jgi:hypothetical protein